MLKKIKLDEYNSEFFQGTRKVAPKETAFLNAKDCMKITLSKSKKQQ
jgi:hypothetical protein